MNHFPGADHAGDTMVAGAPVGDVVREGDGAGLVLPPLPPLPPGRTYQAWAIVGDAAPVSLGLVAPGARVALARGAEADVLAIASEPAGGSAQPTTAPVFSAELA